MDLSIAQIFIGKYASVLKIEGENDVRRVQQQVKNVKPIHAIRYNGTKLKDTRNLGALLLA